MKPLEGIRILDLSRVLAGPLATQVLADLGAEVIKVERPGGGDETRAWGPPYFDEDAGMSAYFLAVNRGKEGRVLDFADPDDLSQIKELALNSHVVVENFKVGGLKKFGLDADRLRSEKPELIYLSLTGFGQTGPRAQEAGYDLLVQGLSGFMSITGDEEPMKVGVAIIDLLTGLYAVIAILAALRKRDQAQGGTTIDLALFDVAVASLANQAMNYLVSGTVPARLGNAHPNIAPYEVFEVADGQLILALGNDTQFNAFCGAVGLDQLPGDPRFASNAQRLTHRAALKAALAPVLKTKLRQTWMDLLKPYKLPCGPIQSLDEVFADPQTRARGLVQDLGAVPTLTSPIRFDGTPLLSRRPPPKRN